MGESDPKVPTQREPEWVREAHIRGLSIEEISGVFVVTKTNDRPLWDGGELAERDSGASDSGKQVGMRQPAKDE